MMITKELLKQEIDLLDEQYFQLIYKLLHQFPHVKTTTDHTPAAFADFANDPVVGMWEDREDMRDSTAWVKNLRQTHWQSPS